MILTHDKILEEIKNGKITITPFDESQVGPASVDLRLSTTFRRYKHVNGVVEVNENVNYEDITDVFELAKNQTLLIKPGETILGITEEQITLDSSLCGWLEGRSRFARIGLAIHVTAGFMQPGISNKQVLEMTNLGPNPLGLLPGVRICQFVFQRCDGNATYTGRFKAQKLS